MRSATFVHVSKPWVINYNNLTDLLVFMDNSGVLGSLTSVNVTFTNYPDDNIMWSYVDNTGTVIIFENVPIICQSNDAVFFLIWWENWF